MCSGRVPFFDFYCGLNLNIMPGSDSTVIEYGDDDVGDVAIPDDLRVRSPVPCTQCEMVRLARLYASTVERSESRLGQVTSAFLREFNSLHTGCHRHLRIALRRVQVTETVDLTVTTPSPTPSSPHTSPLPKRYHHSSFQPRTLSGRFARQRWSLEPEVRPRKRTHSVARARFVTRPRSSSKSPSQPRRITQAMRRRLAQDRRRSSVAEAVRQLSPPAESLILSPTFSLDIPAVEARIARDALAEYLAQLHSTTVGECEPNTQPSHHQLPPLDMASTSSGIPPPL